MDELHADLEDALARLGGEVKASPCGCAESAGGEPDPFADLTAEGDGDPGEALERALADVAQLGQEGWAATEEFEAETVFSDLEDEDCGCSCGIDIATLLAQNPGLRISIAT